MRKLIIIISVVILTGIVLYGAYSLFLKRTPEKILKTVFNIRLKDFDYNVEIFEEEWCANGDGYTMINYKFNKLTQKNIDYLKGFDLKSLPISETEYRQMHPNKIPKQFFNANGYYLFRIGRISDNRLEKGGKMALDFYIFIVDIEKNTAILYYSFM